MPVVGRFSYCHGSAQFLANNRAKEVSGYTGWRFDRKAQESGPVYCYRMAKKPYRVEVNYPKSGRPQYYLVKDVRVKGKKRKAKKYLGVKQPTFDQLEKYRIIYAPEMEMKVAKKKAELSSSFYSSDYLTKGNIKLLEELHYTWIAVLDLLSTNEKEAYDRDFEITYIHGTTFLEGNTISLNEAKDLLRYDMTPMDKTLREINEVQNFKKVVQYRNKYRGKVSLDFIKNLHSLIMHNIDIDSAGSFRRADDVGIEGYDHFLCPAMMIEEELQKAIDKFYLGLDDGKHPFELAIFFHHQFEVIHPFSDGNGRVGREVLNYTLMRNKFPKLLFLGKDRGEYITALKCGDEMKYSLMVQTFYEIIMAQRYKILKENLKNLSKPIKKKGQLRLPDFIET